MNTSVVILVLTILAAIAAFWANKQDSNQKDRIETLGQTNTDLTEQVRKLSILNNDIANNAQKIADRNSELAVKNLQLTTKANELISRVDLLTEQSYELVKKLDTKTDEEFAVSGEFEFSINQGKSIVQIYSIEMGGNLALVTYNQRNMSLIHIGDVCDIYLRDFKLMVTGKFYDLQRNLIAEIEENRWRVSKTSVSKFNFDENGFEVFDIKGRLVVQFDIRGPKIKLQGYFAAKSMKVLTVTDNGGSLDFPYGTDTLNKEVYKYYDKHLNSRSLFIYCGNRWHGIRRTEENTPNPPTNR